MLKRFILGIVLLLPIAAAGQNVKTYIPEKAFQFLPLVYQEADRIMPEMPFPFYFPALIEHESCISLKHSRCWSPTSQLLTERERGAGLFQLTKAFRADGSIRFDSLSDMRKVHYNELKELSWNNILQRPDLQIRAGILLTRSNYQALFPITNPWERLAMTDAAYNGGLGHVNQDRRLCGLKANCDPLKWFDNVELHSVKSRKPLYGNRSAFDINRHHVKDVLYTRMPKYQHYYFTRSYD